MKTNKKVLLINKGLIDYKECWDFQDQIFKEIVQQKIDIRKGLIEEKPSNNYLIFCEHNHVYTLGKSGDKSNLLLSEELLKSKKATYYHINRGGDITYHGPGQIIGYPIFDLENFFTDIHKYLRLLEEAVILTLKDYGVVAERVDGLTGVWIDGNNQLKARKICAIGVKCSRWVTMHGFAFNVNTDLSYFNNIVPCGISDKSVTSLENELGKKMNFYEVKKNLLSHLVNLFEIEVL